MSKKLEGKVVILTGASTGLGKQVAIRMAEEGANLTICARTESKLLETKAICEEKGAKVLAIPCDISIYENLEKLVNETVKEFGGIDVLINNAMSGNHYTPFLDHTVADFEGFLNSNLYPTMHLMKLCYPYLKEKKNGSIINVSSGCALTGEAGMAAYAAIKGAVTSLSKVVANEWGKDGIRVNMVNPAALTDKLAASSAGYIDHVKQALASNPLNAVGDPYNDIAPVYVFLASDDSRFLTGQTLHAEGGMFMYI